MRKLFWLFMMLLLAGCGGGGGTPAANSPSASGKGGLSLELVQSETRVAKTVALLPVTQPGRYRIVLNETTTNYRKVVDRAFLEPLGTIELPVGDYRVEAIFYESGTPNVLTAYGIYKAGTPAVPATLHIVAGTNTSAALPMENIAVVMPTPTSAVDSGATYDVGAIAAADLEAKGLGEKWSLTSSTSPFTGRKHLSQPATATHTGLTAPAVGQSGNLYFQGEFFMKPDLLDAGELANNWAFFTEDDTALNVSTIPINFGGSLPNDTQDPVVKAFNVPSAKQPTPMVSQISIVGTDNGGIKEYAITTTAGPVTGAALAGLPEPAATDWSSTPSFTLDGTVGSTDQTVYVYAWVRDFSGNVSAQVDGVTNKKIVFNNSPVVTSFTVPTTTVMDSNSIPVTIVGKGYQTPNDLQFTITETPTEPSAGWSTVTASAAGTASFTTSYNASFTQSVGVKYNVSLYAWVKDSAGHVSPYALRTVTVNDSPQITALAATGAATGNTVNITRLDVATFPDRTINGYCLTSTSVKPAVSAFTSGVPTLPLSYEFTTGITSTNPVTRAVYVWVKDTEGAISTRGVYVTLSAPTQLLRSRES